MIEPETCEVVDRESARENHFRTNVNEKINAETLQRDSQNGSPIDGSFEILSSSVANSLTMENNIKEEDKTSQRADDLVNKSTKSESDSRRGSSNEKIRKSGSFLSKFHSSQDDGADSSNIPSSIASAFSSISSFTSNFTLNPSSNGNNNASSLTIETASTSTKLSQTTETREEIFAKKASLERKNLISLTKLIIKDLISSSLTAGRTIDDNHNVVHLNNYFTLIDKVLKHGLKQNILSNKSASLWSVLEGLPKHLKESTLISESVRSLAHTKTPDGKIKAWMRLAMMQKKVPEYFNELLANKNVLLKDIYHDYAFMLNDEAHVFAGLIIGVNVIDCNFFAKDANFDLMDDIIDLSPYLRAANSYDDEQDSIPNRDESLSSLTKVLDQKNYLEELNKRLDSTINNLQTRIKTLEEHNSKLEMEAKVSEVRIMNLQSGRSTTPTGPIAETIKNLVGNSSTLSQRLTEPTDSTNKDTTKAQTSEKPKDESDVIKIGAKEPDQDVSIKSTETVVLPRELEDDYKKQISELEKELSGLKERVGILETSYRRSLEKIKTLERDLDVQTSMNTDKDTTIKIYEKDIRDKQAQVESLRTSLNDLKKLNSESSERLNDVSTKLKDRIKSVSNLQASLDKWKLENKTMASKLQEKLSALKSMSTELEKAKATIEDLKKYNEKINDDLKKERECGHSSTVTLETQNNKIIELREKLSKYENELNEVRPYRDQTEELQKRCQDYEQSLEEIGGQLKQARLELESLKENSAVFLDSQWMDSRQVKSCALCQQVFSVTRRKHHCRLCGNVFCQTCSDNKMELASSSKPARVCDTCHAFLLAKFVKSSSTQ